MASNTVNILIKADDQASREIDNVSGSTNKLGQTMASVGKIATGFLAAEGIATGLNMLTTGINNAVEGWKEHLQVAAQTDAVLKSTAGVAGVTAEQVEALAASIQKMSLFEDDAIQSGENLLLTFTNIGSDIFPRATQAMVDMSQALGQDLSSSAIQLGKALNDPINGVTALQRVGVSFTEQQREQIKAMTEAGDVAGAQALILAELERQFAGSAKSASDAAGASAELEDRMDELNDTLGQKLLPLQMKWKELQIEIVDLLLGRVIPAIEDFNEEHSELAANVGKTADFIGKHWDFIVAVIEAALQPVLNVFNGIIRGMEGVSQAFGGTVAFFDDLVHGRWSQLWTDAGTIVGGIADVIMGAFRIMVGDVEAQFNGLVGTIRSAVNTAIGFINRLISAWNGLSFSAGGGSVLGVPIPSISFGTPDLPLIPLLAQGGIVTRPTLAMLGEAGPEAVVPLSGRHGMGGTVINVPVYIAGSVISERQLVRVIRDEFLHGGFSDIFNNFGLGAQGGA
jgi:hypothetical protein